MMSKKQIRQALRRFEADPGRVLSINLFCEVAGISHDTYQNVRSGVTEMTPTVQRRLEIALQKLERGELKVMRRPNQTKYVSYRKSAQPELKRGYAITMKGGKIGLRTGIVNANSYAGPSFKEEIDRGHS